MVNASNKIRVGIVGMGRTAAFMRPVAAHPYATLAAVCDLREDICRSALNRYGIEAPQPAIYTDYGTMLQAGGLDAAAYGAGLDQGRRLVIRKGITGGDFSVDTQPAIAYLSR